MTACLEGLQMSVVGWLEFNVPFQHKYGYTRHEEMSVNFTTIMPMPNDKGSSRYLSAVVVCKMI